MCTFCPSPQAAIKLLCAHRLERRAMTQDEIDALLQFIQHVDPPHRSVDPPHRSVEHEQHYSSPPTSKGSPMAITLRCDRCGATAPPKVAQINHLQLPDNWLARTVHPGDNGGLSMRTAHHRPPGASEPYDVLACSEACAQALDAVDPRDELGDMTPGD
jgi:hypothetical protein